MLYFSLEVFQQQSIHFHKLSHLVILLHLPFEKFPFILIIKYLLLSSRDYSDCHAISFSITLNYFQGGLGPCGPCGFSDSSSNSVTGSKKSRTGQIHWFNEKEQICWEFVEKRN